MMKQPELGQKLLALRSQKNMTQEDLVEACNVSVRTIQRIETGEVTPRVSTIKIILAALEADLDSVSSNGQTNKTTHQLHSIENILQVAWISGIVYFALGFLDAALDYQRMESGNEVESFTLYIATKIAYFVFYTLFMLGLIRLGDYFSNYLLKISGYLMIGFFLIITGYDILSLFLDISEVTQLTIGGGESVTFGALGIVLGIGLMRLQDGMGQLARIAGMLEVLAGFFFALIFLFFLGYILLIPATIVEIILLYKGYEFIKNERLNA